MEKTADRNADLERSLLSGLLNAPDRMFEVEDAVSPDTFLGAGRRTIFQAMLSLHRRSADLDLLAIKGEVERANGGPVAGISSALSSLIGYTSTGSHVLHHARLLRSRFVLGQIANIAGAAIEEAPSVVPDEDSVGNYLEGLMTSLYDLSGKIDKVQQHDLRSQVAAAFARLDARDGGVVGIRTGFYDLDDMLHGLRPGQLIVCGGRPSMGKSAFGTTLVMHAASHTHHEFSRRARCALISLEMGVDQIVTRMLSAQSGVKGHRIFTGRLDQDERSRVVEAASWVSDLPLVIDDSPTMTVHRLRGRLRRIQQQQGLDLAVIDYVQLLHSGRKSESRQLEVSAISASLKALARELEIPIVALCQLSRGVETADKKRPLLSHLRESGSLEQDADVVLFLYREGYYYDGVDEKMAEVIVAKNREGRTGKVELFFRPETTRFESREAQPAQRAEPAEAPKEFLST